MTTNSPSSESAPSQADPASSSPEDGKSPRVAFSGAGRHGGKTLILRLVLTVACVAVLFHWWRTRPALDIVQIRWGWGLAALALSPVILVLRAWKWRACLRGLGELPGTWESLRSYVGALPLAAVTPGRAGELARPIYFRDENLRRLEVSGRLLLDNWTDTLAVVLCTMPGCFWLFDGWGLGLGLAAFALLACIPWWLRLAHWAVERMGRDGWMGRARGVLLRLLPPADAAGKRLLVETTLLGMVAYVAEAAQFWTLLLFLGQGGANFVPLFSGLALIHLANSVQFTVAGIGPREGMTVWLLAKLGLSQGTLMGASFLQTALIFLLPAGAGLVIRPATESEPVPDDKVGKIDGTRARMP